MNPATKQSLTRPSPGFVDRGLSYTLLLMVELLIGRWAVRPQQSVHNVRLVTLGQECESVRNQINIPANLFHIRGKSNE